MRNEKIALIQTMKLELISPAAGVVRKSLHLEIKSAFRPGDSVLVMGHSAKVHLILGRGARKGPMNYLVELPDNTDSCFWNAKYMDRKCLGMHPDKKYRIALEQWITKN